jgi:hypothetical protein
MFLYSILRQYLRHLSRLCIHFFNIFEKSNKKIEKLFIK